MKQAEHEDCACLCILLRKDFWGFIELGMHSASVHFVYLSYKSAFFLLRCHNMLSMLE